MSAFICNEDHFRLLAQAACYPPNQGHQGPLTWWAAHPADLFEEHIVQDDDEAAYREAMDAAQRKAERVDDGSHTSPTGIATMLLRANVAAVRERYDSNDLPGPVDLVDKVNEDPGHEIQFHRVARSVSPMRVIKAIHCYRYQSSGGTDWRQSEARHFCDALEQRMITALPGYDAAGWEFHADEAPDFIHAAAG